MSYEVFRVSEVIFQVNKYKGLSVFGIFNLYNSWLELYWIRKGWFLCEIWTLHNSKCTTLWTKCHISTLTHQTLSLWLSIFPESWHKEWHWLKTTPSHSWLNFKSLHSHTAVFNPWILHLLLFTSSPFLFILPYLCHLYITAPFHIPSPFLSFSLSFFPFGKAAALDKGNSSFIHHLHLRSWIWIFLILIFILFKFFVQVGTV